MCTTGHNSYHGCRFCYIRGTIANRHVYYPLEPPNDVIRTKYNPRALPLRTHQSYTEDISAIMIAEGTARDREQRDRGIESFEFQWMLNYFTMSPFLSIGVNGRSVLFELSSIKFPTSFPVDIMHGLFENVAPAMLRHWNGTFFKDGHGGEYVLHTQTWATIGQILEKNRENMPADFGRPPIDIHKYSASLKAEDWSNWVVLYSLPLLHNRLPPR